MRDYGLYCIFLLVFISLLHLVEVTEQAITTDSCGKTKGCLRDPASCNGTDCNFLATYSYRHDHIEFELFGNDSAYVSIGFNDIQEMVNADSIVCYVNNSVVYIRSAKLTAKSSPKLDETEELNLTDSSMAENSVECRFTHPYRPTNGSKLRSLDNEFYLIYGTGQFGNNGLGYHYTKRGVSAYHVNLTTNVDSRTASAALATEDCGKTVGCLRYPLGCNGTDCSYMATYRYQNDSVIFEMFGSSAEWVAIGFSDSDVMPDTDAVVCQRVDQTVVVRSSRIATKSSPPLDVANDLVLTGKSFFSNNIQCRFSHPYIPEAGSTLRNLSQDVFLLYAKGSLKPDGSIGYHTGEDSHRGASPQRVDLKTGLDIGKEEPRGGISTDGCGKTVGCLRFQRGCSGSSCEFAATYRYELTTNVVTFEMFGKNADWAAIGFSDNQEMPNTDAVFCYKLNGSVIIRSARLTGRIRPNLDEEKDLVLLNSSMEGGIRCRFNYPVIPENTSKLRRLDQEVFLLYAKGSVSSLPNRHTTTPSGRGSSSEPVNVTTTFRSETTSQGISTDGCGKTVGCLRFQRGCSGSSCEFVATYRYELTTNVVTFEMFGKNADWAAIGFSDDMKMPDTDSVFCYKLNGRVIIRSARLTGRSRPSLDEENDLVLLDSSMEGGIRCRFDYPLIPGNTSKLRRLDQELVFLLYAKGPVSGLPNQHTDTSSGRGSSSEPVNVTTTFESETTSPSQVNKKVHGSLMAIVWILLASSGLFFARYTRDNWPDTKLFGTKVWFQFHRFLMIVVVLGTIVSIVVIFVDLDGFTEQEGLVKTHAIIGLVVLALAVAQPIGALLRPHPETPKRPIFNFFHRAFGVSAFILAIVAIILGLDIFNKEEAYYTVIGYAGFLAGVLFIMEISKFIHDRAEESVEEVTVPGGMQIQNSITVKKSFHLTLSQALLIIVDIISLAITMVVIYFIAKDEEE